MNDDFINDNSLDDGSATDSSDKNVLREKVITVLKTIYDPEIPVNIYDLGLIYVVDIDDDANATIQMTLTVPGCPFAQTFPGMVEYEVQNVAGINDARVELVWEPPWSQDMMSEEARLTLGLL